MWQNLLLDMWGCIPELSKDCQDMTNASSTYLGIVVGAIIGGIISWWIYNRQNKTSEQQELTLNQIKELNERHDSILKRIHEFDKRHDSTLNAILELDRKIEQIIERQQNLPDWTQTSKSSKYHNTDTGKRDSQE